MSGLPHTDPPCEACRFEALEKIKLATERFSVLIELAKEQTEIVEAACLKHRANMESLIK